MSELATLDPSQVVAASPRPQGNSKTAQQANKKTGRQSDQGTGRQSDQGTARPVVKPIKTAVYLSPDVFLDLGVACVYERKSQSEIIEHLIKKALKPYGTSIRGDRIRFDEDSDRAKTAAEPNQSPPIPQ